MKRIIITFIIIIGLLGAGFLSPLTLTTASAANSNISPASGSFDKNISAQEDVSTTLTLNGNTLASITNDSAPLVQDADYIISGDTLIVRKSYLAAQAVGITTLTLNFSAGDSQTFTITVSCSASSGGSGGGGGSMPPSTTPSSTGGGSGGGGGGGTSTLVSYDVIGGQLIFNLTTGTITGYTGSPTNVEIPVEISGVPVIRIGTEAFYNCSSLTSISISNSIISIGSRAFSWTGLISISIPESITRIEWETFKFCMSLTSVNIPESVTSISDEAFANCYSLTSINIPGGVTSVGKGAFGYCKALTAITVADNNQKYVSVDGVFFNKARTILLACPGGLTGISMPAGITGIGDSAFEGCKKITSIDITEGVINIGDFAFDGCSALTSISIPESLTGIGFDAFFGCSGLVSIYILKNVTSISHNPYIGQNPFGLCRSLTAITVSNDNQNYASVDGVLYNKAKTILLACPGGLTGVNIPASANCIGDNAFLECNGLTSIIIPEAITSIGNQSFFACRNLTSISIPQGATSIGSRAFVYCSNLNSITFNSATTTIYEDEETIPAATKIIGYDPSTAKDYATKYNRTFAVIGTTQPIDPDYTYTVTDDKATITKYTGAGGDVTIPGTLDVYPVTSIENYTFENCTGLTSIVIPESVTSIGYRAFFTCPSLTNIIIPPGVTRIGDFAFGGCTGLTNITFNSATTTIYDGVYTIPETTKIIGYDPSTAKDYATKYSRTFNSIESDYTYTVTDGKAKITKYTGTGGAVTIPSILGGFPVTSIGDSAFQDCSGLTSVIIGSEVTSIGAYAFQGCTGLTSIKIPDGVTSIGEYAFEGCSNLEYSYYVQDGKAIIGKYKGAERAVLIPTTLEGWPVTGIREQAFDGCKGLISITIPQGVTNIYDGAFWNCPDLTSIVVDTNNSIYASVGGVLYNKAGTILKACPGGLISISIPESVTIIGNTAFGRCKGLTSITIPEGITSIGDSAFAFCEGLTSITIPRGVISICYSFSYCTALNSITFNSATTVIGGNEEAIPVTTKIIGYDPSTAKDYAAKYGRTFEVLSAQPVEGCFIATAAFGSKFTWPVALLRHFRDQYLLTNSWGTTFVNFYYKYSPPIAAMIATSQPLKMLVRVLLMPLIALVYLMYHPEIMVMMFGVGIFMLVVWFMRRRYLYME